MSKMDKKEITKAITKFAKKYGHSASTRNRRRELKMRKIYYDNPNDGTRYWIQDEEIWSAPLLLKGGINESDASPDWMGDNIGEPRKDDGKHRAEMKKILLNMEV